MKKKNEILSQLLGNDITIEDAMNRAMHIAIVLCDKNLQYWISKEVNGYSTAETVPDYRNMSGLIVVYDSNAQRYELPQIVTDKNYQIVSHQGNALGIAGIQSCINDSDLFIEASIPVENFPFIQTFSPVKIIDAKLKVPKTQFVDILTTVKTELVRRLSEKSKEVGNLNKYDIGKKMKKETKITFNDKSINVGDGNIINGSNIGNDNQITPKTKDRNFIEKHPVLLGIIIAFIGGVLVYVFLETQLWDSIKAIISKSGI